MADEVTTGTTAAAPVEGAAPAELETTTETPAEGEPAGEVASTEAPAAEKTAEELAAAEEAQKAADADFLSKLPELLKKIPEADQRRLGLQYANRTMAAARRAEKATATVQAENLSLKAKLAERSNAPDIRKDVSGWMKANGFATARDIVDHLIGAKADAKPDPLDEIAALRKERDEERAAAAAERERAIDEQSKANVAGALAKDASKFHYASKPSGTARVWAEIVEYRKLHDGKCPDAIVFHLAQGVEREMRSEFGEPARPAAKVTPAAGAARPAASASGTTAATITSKGSGGAPVVREYSNDPDERREQIRKDLIAEGLLQQSTG